MPNRVFDENDVGYLARHLTEAQLNKELRNHNVRRAFEIQKRWPLCLDSEDRFYLEFACVVQKAIEKTRTNKPRIRGSINLDVDEIKANLDIVQLIGKYTQLRQSGRNYTGICPFHFEKHPSFTVYPQSQSWYCFSCNRGGDVISFITLIEKVEFKSALVILAGGNS
jgi:hypothetical protein